MLRRPRACLATLALFASFGAPGTENPDQDHAIPARVLLPKTGLEPRELAVIVNDADPASPEIGEYYRRQRQIPAENLIHVKFQSGTTLPSEGFAKVRKDVERQLPSHIQALALAWTTPYRVDCMSITSAFALGFDRANCSTACGATKPSRYFDSPSAAPYTDLKIRPTMMLAGESVGAIKSLIDRGIASDVTYPTGTGYLLKTADQARSVRSVTFDATVTRLGQAFHLEAIDADYIRDKDDVLFYFTGLVEVPYLDTLHFLPGAVADHLTSTGGQLTGSKQMSSLRWLEAGATGSYGAVVEPCNHLQKFPFPAVVMGHYASGASLIEAYWKSVAWPGEGVFIGEPLARPYRPTLTPIDDRHVRVRLFAPLRRPLGLEISASPVGPYHLSETRYELSPGLNDLAIELPDAEHFFRLTYDISAVRAKVDPRARPRSP